MKKYYYLVIIVIGLALSSCLKKSVDAANTAALIGTWHIKTDTLASWTNGVLNWKHVDDMTPTETWQFNSDGTTNVNNTNGPSTYTVSGSTLSIKYLETDGSHSTDVWTIKSVSASSLILVYDVSSTSGGKNYRDYQYFGLYK